MRKITIIGAGQSGLQLGIGLLKNGYDVTLVTDRSRQEVESGRILSSQCMFDMALQHERDLGLNLWDNTCPPIDGIGLAIAGPDGTRVVDWAARLDAPAPSVDQRVKMPAWMALFGEGGGNLLSMYASLDDLDSNRRSLAQRRTELARQLDTENAALGEMGPVPSGCRPKWPHAALLVAHLE